MYVEIRSLHSSAQLRINTFCSSPALLGGQVLGSSLEKLLSHQRSHNVLLLCGSTLLLTMQPVFVGALCHLQVTKLGIQIGLNKKGNLLGNVTEN